MYQHDSSIKVMSYRAKCPYFFWTVLSVCMTLSHATHAQSIDYKNLLKDSGDVVIHRGILFDYNASQLLPESRLQLDTLANHLLLNPVLVIEVGVHGDVRGSAKYHLHLTERQAKTIVEYLTNKGVNKTSLLPRGYGKNQVLYPQPKSEEEHRLNRRTEFKVIRLLPE
jgi:outer membrane protein OmpA-like peptidoglycan-associated protein